MSQDWQPLNRIRLLREVKGDSPFNHAVALPRVYEQREIYVNLHGAVSVLTTGGYLGVKPGEFEWIDSDVMEDQFVRQHKLASLESAMAHPEGTFHVAGPVLNDFALSMAEDGLVECLNFSVFMGGTFRITEAGRRYVMENAIPAWW